MRKNKLKDDGLAPLIDEGEQLQTKALSIISIVYSLVSLVLALIVVLFIPKLIQIFLIDTGILVIFAVFIFLIVAVSLSAAFVIPCLIGFITAAIQIGKARTKTSIIAMILAIITVAVSVVVVIALFRSLY